MRASSTAEIRKAARERILQHALTKIHGRPTLADVDGLFEEVCQLLTDVDSTYDHAGKFGCLFLALDDEKYCHVTGNDKEAINEPDSTPTYPARASQSEIQDIKDKHNVEVQAWATQQAVEEAVVELLKNALDEQYYKQLKKKLIGYKRVTILEFFDHLGKWTTVTNQVKRTLRNDYYSGWNHTGSEHISEFQRRLEDDQVRLTDLGIPISDSEVFEHYVGEMYKSKKFSKQQMIDYEKKMEQLADTEDEWEVTTEYFSDIVGDNETYDENVTGAGMKDHGYESMNNVNEENEDPNVMSVLGDIAQAACADKEHIQQMTATNGRAVDIATNLTTSLAEKEKQLTTLIDTNAKHVKKIDELERILKKKNPNVTFSAPKGCQIAPPDYGARPRRSFEKVTKGGYCHTHGFDPFGQNHTSETCKNKGPNHKDGATINDRRGGATFFKPEGFVL